MQLNFKDLELDEVLMNSFDYSLATNTMFTLSHGALPTNKDNKKQCVIPPNIILHQYTLPLQPLHTTQVDSISNFLIKNKNTYKNYSNTFYRVNKAGDINVQRIVERVMCPGSKTTNLELSFDQTVNSFTMGISCDFKKPVQLGVSSQPVMCTLEQMLNKISNTYPDSLIHLHQLSCRIGDIDSLDYESRLHETELMTYHMSEQQNTNENYWVFDKEAEATMFSDKLNMMEVDG